MASINYEMPFDLTTESMVLSACLYSFDHFSYVIQTLTVSDFYDPNHGLIFLTYKEFYDKNIPLNINDLLSELKKKGYTASFEKASEFYNEYLSESFAKEKVEDLKSISANRAVLMHMINSIGHFGSSKRCNFEEVTEYTRKCQEIVCQFNGKKGREISDILKEYAGEPKQSFIKHLQILQERYQKGFQIELGYPTHLIDFDKEFDGFKEGHLTIIGARPGVGKTSLMCNLVLSHALQNKLPILIFSLEMPETEIVDKIVYAHANIEGKKIKSGHINGIEFQKINVASHEIQNSTIIIDDSAGIPISLIESRSEYWKMQKDIKIIFIDYLQLITGGKKFNSKYEEVTFISQRLKVLAKRLNVCVITLAQLNRDATKAGNKPRMHDLRDSGQIEQDADEIFLLHCPSAEDPYNKPNILELIIAKNRFGKLATIDLFFNKETGKISNLSNLKEIHHEEWDKRFP